MVVGPVREGGLTLAETATSRVLETPQRVYYPIYQRLGVRRRSDIRKNDRRKRLREMNKNLWIWIRDIAIAVAIAVVIMQFIKPTIVKEHSMEDTLFPNDYIFLSKQAYNLGSEPRRGDIVVFRSDLENKDGTKKNLIKRVIAVTGDMVAIHDGVVYVNGEALEEPYTKDGYTNGQMPEITVPDGDLFLLGDNRQSSSDSRDPAVGVVSVDRLLGKAVFRVFPLSNFGPVG
jgi:signal peptidase I